VLDWHVNSPVFFATQGTGRYDQAHMTREWNALAGCTPGIWIARELPFIQDYELSGRDDERVHA